MPISSAAMRPRMPRDPLDALEIAREVHRRAYTRVVKTGLGAAGAGCIFGYPLHLAHPKRIHLGRQVELGSGVTLIAYGGAITMGDGCRLANGASIAAGVSVVLEKEVWIGANAQIVDGQHASDDPERTIASQGMRGGAPVRLCTGAWIGTGAVVMPGVTVGRNAIVGANAVVRDDVPDHGVAVGIPARILDVRSYELGAARGATTPSGGPAYSRS